VPGPQAEHVAAAVQVDPDRGVERLVADLPVADLHHDRVDEHRRIHRLQRPGRPRRHVLDDPVGDPRHGVRGDRRAYTSATWALISPVVSPRAYSESTTASTSDTLALPLLHDHRFERGRSGPGAPAPRRR
jgi:hypothetical protein